MSPNHQLVTRWIPSEPQQFNFAKHRLQFWKERKRLLLSETPRLSLSPGDAHLSHSHCRGIIIAKHCLRYFGKKKQDFHRTLQLHGSSSLLCLGISANWGWVGQCECGLHQAMLLRVSKNQDTGSPGAWKGKQWYRSCRSPK